MHTAVTFSMADLERRAKAFAAKEKKRGVVYLSRVPPYMKPAKVKHLMAQFGSVNRIYLAAEPAENRKRRGGRRWSRTAAVLAHRIGLVRLASSCGLRSRPS